ncbi:MAG TPA: hypothetical protein VGF58_19455 [Burkholderiales bacterium]|jgi:hypothetical protein
MDLSNIEVVVSAAGALGLASYALVDASKVGRYGGVSNAGFRFIEHAVRQLLPSEHLNLATARSHGRRSVLDVLHANWINGSPLGDQKAIAKSLIKLRLTKDTAEAFAKATLVDQDVLSAVAEKMAKGGKLGDEETNVLGRFDLGLTAILDEGYQRADQKYRNSARVLAAIVAVVLAVLGGWVVSGSSYWDYLKSSDVWVALLCGLISVPIAPITKDLTSALQAGVKLAQTIKK